MWVFNVESITAICVGNNIVSLVLPQFHNMFLRKKAVLSIFFFHREKYNEKRKAYLKISSVPICHCKQLNCSFYYFQFFYIKVVETVFEVLLDSCVVKEGFSY
jgi:hypothetical protein